MNKMIRKEECPGCKALVDSRKAIVRTGRIGWWTLAFVNLTHVAEGGWIAVLSVALVVGCLYMLWTLRPVDLQSPLAKEGEVPEQ